MKEDGSEQDLNHPHGTIPDISAPIVPGVCAGGIFIGSRFAPPPEDGDKYEIQRRKDSVVYSLHAVKVWTRNDLVYQIGVYEGYRGVMPEGIGVGSTISEVEDRFHCDVVEDPDGDLVTPCFPGWSFDTAEWNGSRNMNEKSDTVIEFDNRRGVIENLDAPIKVICVFKPVD